jgi:hypothetical protein
VLSALRSWPISRQKRAWRRRKREKVSRLGIGHGVAGCFSILPVGEGGEVTLGFDE